MVLAKDLPKDGLTEVKLEVLWDFQEDSLVGWKVEGWSKEE